MKFEPFLRRWSRRLDVRIACRDLAAGARCMERRGI